MNVEYRAIVDAGFVVQVDDPLIANYWDHHPEKSLEECRAYFTKIAPDFFKIPGFLRKQFICARGGKVAGGVYMWESQEAAERFYSGEWLAGIRARYGTEPKITYFETVALTDKASGQASGLD